MVANLLSLEIEKKFLIELIPNIEEKFIIAKKKYSNNKSIENEKELKRLLLCKQIIKKLS